MKGMKKMRALCIALVAVMLLGIWSVPAQAAVVGNIIPNVPYVPDKIYYYDHDYAKFVMPYDGFVKISMFGPGPFNYDKIYVYDRNLNPLSYRDDYGSGQPFYNGELIALDKGVYYIQSSYSWGITHIELKTYKGTYKNNVSYQKATPIKSNKWYVALKSPAHNKTNWYKIKLSKRQRVRIYVVKNSEYANTQRVGDDTWSAADSARISLITNKKKLVELTYDEDSGYYYSTNSLAKGTYYIRIGIDDSDIPHEVRMFKIKYK